MRGTRETCFLHHKLFSPKEFVVPYNPCVGMSSEEMNHYVMYLMEQLDAIREELRVSKAEQQRQNALVLSLTE